MKNVLLILSIFVINNITGQVRIGDLEDKSIDEFRFDYELVDDGSLDYPIMKQDANFYDIRDVAILHGIKIGYTYQSTTEIDDITAWDASKAQTFSVNVYFTNTMNHDIVYPAHSDFAIAMVRFPSKDGFFNDKEGMCVLRTTDLEVIRGRPTFKANKELVYNFNFSQVSENFIESSTQSHFYPMEALGAIPKETLERAKPTDDLRAFRETSSLSNIERSEQMQMGSNIAVAFIKFPKKYAHLTSGSPRVKSNHVFEKNGDYTVLYKSDHLMLEYKPLDNNGKFNYRVSNLTDQVLDREHKPIAWLYFVQGVPVKLWPQGEPKGPSSSWHYQKLKPHEVYVGTFSVELRHLSGEYFKDGDKLIPRKKYTRDYVPFILEVAKPKGAHHTAEYASGKAAINVLFPNKTSSNPGKEGSIYFNNAYHVLPRGQIVKIECEEEGVYTFFTTAERFQYPEKTITKMLSDSPGMWGSGQGKPNISLGKQFYFVVSSSGGAPTSVSEEQWNNLIGQSQNVNSSLIGQPVVYSSK